MQCGGLGTNPERCGETRRGAVSDLSTTVFGGVEPKVGIEPTTYALPRRCSTSEPLGLGHRTGRWYPMAADGEAPDPPAPILPQAGRGHQPRAGAPGRGASGPAIGLIGSGGLSLSA